MLKFYFCLLFTVVTFTSAQRTPSRFRSGTRSTTTTTPSPDYGDYPDVPTTTHATVHTTTRNSRNQAGNRGIARSANRVAVSGSASASSAHPAAPAFAGAHNEVRQGGPLSLQSQDPYVALDTLRGKSALMADEIQEIMFSARPGVDFPILSTIPDPTSFQCENQKQPGFYADPDFRCQVFRRCDPSGQLFSFLCPNTTIFNQITLTCDYWYNVDCAKSTGFYDFANARLYHENWPLLGGL